MAIINVNNKLSAAEVRRLEVGTPVILHGRDRRGYSTELHCTVVQSGKSKALAYRDVDGSRQTKPIRDYPNKYYTKGGRGCGL